MWMQQKRTRGQSVAEYAIVFSVVAAAIVGMQIFLKRGLQAREKDMTDYMTSITGPALAEGGAKGAALLATKQYEPYYATSNFNVTQDNDETSKYQAGGLVNRNVAKQNTTRTGSSTTDVTQAADAGWK